MHRHRCTSVYTYTHPRACVCTHMKARKPGHTHACTHTCGHRQMHTWAATDRCTHGHTVKLMKQRSSKQDLGGSNSVEA